MIAGDFANNLEPSLSCNGDHLTFSNFLAGPYVAAPSDHLIRETT